MPWIVNFYDAFNEKDYTGAMLYALMVGVLITSLININKSK